MRLEDQIAELIGRGACHEASQLLDERLRDEPRARGLLRLKARVLMASMQYDAALAVWREVAAVGPPAARTHLEMARCLAELESLEEAAHELQTAVALNYELREEAEDDYRLSRVLSQM